MLFLPFDYKKMFTGGDTSFLKAIVVGVQRQYLGLMLVQAVSQ